MVARMSSEFTVKINNQDIILFFRRPNQAELFEIDLQYRKIYSEALRNGVMTESEAKKLLKKNGAWLKEDDDRVTNLAFEIAQKQKILEKHKDSPKAEVLELINGIIGLRNDLIELIGQRTSMFSQTAEGIANDQRIHKLIELCLINKETNEPFFAGLEQYRSFASTNSDELSTIYKNAWLFEYNTKENLEDEFPEMKILKELAEIEKSEAEKAVQEQPKVEASAPAAEKTE